VSSRAAANERERNERVVDGSRAEFQRRDFFANPNTCLPRLYITSPPRKPSSYTTERGTIVYGTIKKIIKDKGFGFITPDDGGDEIFFHKSKIAPKIYFEDLREGLEVQFDVRPGEKGRQAFNLRIR